MWNIHRIKRMITILEQETPASKDSTEGVQAQPIPCYAACPTYQTEAKTKTHGYLKTIAGWGSIKASTPRDSK